MLIVQLGELILMVCLHFTYLLLMTSLQILDASLVLLLHGIGIRQFLIEALRLHYTSVKLVALTKQRLYQLLV